MHGWNLKTPHRPRVGGRSDWQLRATPTPKRPRGWNPPGRAPRWNGLRWAYHGLKAQGYVRTPFHGGRVAGWKLVNSLTKIPIRLDARAANVVSVTAKVGSQNA